MKQIDKPHVWTIHHCFINDLIGLDITRANYYFHVIELYGLVFLVLAYSLNLIYYCLTNLKSFFYTFM